LLRVEVQPDKTSLFDLSGGLPDIDLGLDLLVEIESHGATAFVGRGVSLFLLNSHRRKV